MIRISVITPSYNHAKFLGRTIESVRTQRRDFELEHIVVDGGSTDGTLDVLRGLGSTVRWISEPDEGQSDALNKGIAMATGEIIGWLNSDDVYEPDALETVARIFASEPQTQWLYGKVRIIDAGDQEIRRWITRYKNFRMRPFSYRRLLAENWISQMGVFWRAEAGRTVGPFRKDLHYCMDYDYWLRLGGRWPGRFVNRYLGAFRWYPASKSGAGFDCQFREQYEVARIHATGRYPLTLFCHRMHNLRTVSIFRILSIFRPENSRI